MHVVPQAVRQTKVHVHSQGKTVSLSLSLSISASPHIGWDQYVFPGPRAHTAAANQGRQSDGVGEHEGDGGRDTG